MLQRLRNFNENRGEMLQRSDISAEKLPLAALSAHYCEKIYGGQQRKIVRCDSLIRCFFISSWL